MLIFFAPSDQTINQLTTTLTLKRKGTFLCGKKNFRRRVKFPFAFHFSQGTPRREEYKSEWEKITGEIKYAQNSKKRNMNLLCTKVRAQMTRHLSRRRNPSRFPQQHRGSSLKLSETTLTRGTSQTNGVFKHPDQSFHTANSTPPAQTHRPSPTSLSQPPIPLHRSTQDVLRRSWIRRLSLYRFTLYGEVWPHTRSSTIDRGFTVHATTEDTWIQHKKSETTRSGLRVILRLHASWITRGGEVSWDMQTQPENGQTESLRRRNGQVTRCDESRVNILPVKCAPPPPQPDGQF